MRSKKYFFPIYSKNGASLNFLRGISYFRVHLRTSLKIRAFSLFLNECDDLYGYSFSCNHKIPVYFCQQNTKAGRSMQIKQQDTS